MEQGTSGKYRCTILVDYSDNFFPKKTNFMFVDESDILKAQALINNRPRFECNENMISLINVIKTSNHQVFGI